MTAITDESGTVAGVFTDGDLRRALEKSVDIHAAKISNLMGRNPRTIGPDQLAVAAVEKMQHQKINGLLVVDGSGKLVGALNMHDLLKAGVV
jgi:arabinose-5-phosphate isomerase